MNSYAPIFPVLCAVFFTPWLPLSLLEIIKIPCIPQKIILIGQHFATLILWVKGPILQDICHIAIKSVSSTSLAFPPIKDKKKHSKIVYPLLV